MIINDFILAQVYGFFAFIVAIVSVFQTKRIIFIICMILQSLLLCGQYYFLDKFIAIYVCLVSIIRLIVYSFKNYYNQTMDIIILVIFIIINITVSILTFEFWYDIFPLIASTLVCYTIWQNKVVIMKWGLLISKALWGIYACICIAYFSIAIDIFIIIWTSVYLIKYNKKISKI